MGWYEEMQEAARRAREAAVRREYARACQDNEFADNEESWRAFVAGWYGEIDYKSDRQDLTRGGPMAWSIMAWLFGGLLLACIAMIYFLGNPNALIIHRAAFGALIGVVLIGLGFLSLKRERRLSAEADAKFRAKWAKEGG